MYQQRSWLNLLETNRKFSTEKIPLFLCYDAHYYKFKDIVPPKQATSK